MSIKNILLLLLAAVAAFGVIGRHQGAPNEKTALTSSAPASSYALRESASRGIDSAVDRAFASRAHNVQVEGRGTVVKVLRDDDEGSRHQRFLLRLPSGLTILVAHNIDLAPRLEGLRVGDMVAFSGDYEWNEKGGVVHWTHRDPAGRHVAGWLKHDGQTVQ